MSKSFSRRSSLLPPNTASILASELASPGAKSRGEKEQKNEAGEGAGYSVKWHAYAIRMLAELEDAQKEVSAASCTANVTWIRADLTGSTTNGGVRVESVKWTALRLD